MNNNPHMDFFNNTQTTLHPKKLSRSLSLVDWCLYFLMLFLSGYLFIYGALKSGYNWHWEKALNSLVVYNFVADDFFIRAGLLLEGLWVTLQLSFWALLIAFGVGISSALVRVFAGPLCRVTVVLYIELIRNTPLLVQLYLAYILSYYVNISAFTAGVLALGFFEGAYISEIMRAGLLSISQGQREAGYSVGLGKLQTEVLIIFPQAFSVSKPALFSQAITLIKDSSLVSAIAVMELTKTAQIIISETYMVFEIWLLTALLYLCTALFLECLLRRWLKH